MPEGGASLTFTVTDPARFNAGTAKRLTTRVFGETRIVRTAEEAFAVVPALRTTNEPESFPLERRTEPLETVRSGRGTCRRWVVACAPAGVKAQRRRTAATAETGFFKGGRRASNPE